LLLFIVAVGMLRRGLYKQYPVFFAYVTYNAIKFAVVFPILNAPVFNRQLYFDVYCADLGISTALRFAIVGEVAANLFRGQPELARIGKPLLRIAVIVLLLGTIVITRYAGSGGADHSYAVLYSLDRAASIVQCSLFILLLCMTSYLQLSWRSQLLGIALGFGIFASVELVVAAIESQAGSGVDNVMNYVLMGTYQCCVLIWTYYLFVPERKQQFAINTIPKHDLEVWNQELQHLLQK
jgi:hypothetical protein